MSSWVPSRLVIGGDQPFVRRLIGVSTSPMVGSIYNMGVWDKVAAAWVNVATRRTLAREEAARHRYKETGRSLENGGCIGDPHIVVDRCMVFLCILHCLPGHWPAPSGVHRDTPCGPPQGEHRCRATGPLLSPHGCEVGCDGGTRRGGGPCVVPRVGGTWSVVGLRPRGW